MYQEKFEIDGLKKGKYEPPSVCPIPVFFVLYIQRYLYLAAQQLSFYPPTMMMVDDHDLLADDLLSEDDAESEQKEELRPSITCQRCSVEPATVVCRGCLGQFLCGDCDSNCHQMIWQNHQREPLRASDPLAITEGLLSQLVGVESIKDRVREIVITHTESTKTEHMRGLYQTPEPPVILLVGNPGVGKTTIAHVRGQVFVAVGIVTNAKIVWLRKDAISNSPRKFFDNLAKQVSCGVLVVDELQNYSRCTNFTHSSPLRKRTKAWLADRV